MPEPGQTISHYRILQKIGQGGMGEVYQAKDQKLGRDVAIKVLPEEFAKDADRAARFQREAKLLASLNHPNIAAIYGLEESDGIHFLVMELVEGVTLENYIAGNAGVPAGPYINASETLALPAAVPGLLKLALQIAEALEAAHEKGVIHRDLKPANIKVTPDGKVKVLDFGLAKAFAGDQEDMNLSNSPTLSMAATQQGIILGTAAYMPPEQAKGKTVDKRADIWAFGVVLFEMLTGKQVFTGETVSDTLASVLAREPEWNDLPPNLHPRIRFLLERCLKKEPKNRHSSISDARVEIQEVLADPGGVFMQPSSAMEPRMKLRQMLPWIMAAVVLTAIIAGAIGWYLREPAPKRIVRLEHSLPAGQELSNPVIPMLAVSPDGGQFVYSTNEGLYLRSIGELDAKLIAGTEGVQYTPFFSPDGRSIGYFSTADSKIKKISVTGGVPIDLCAVTGVPISPSWGEDENIVYGEVGKGLMRISSYGGDPELLLEQKNQISTPQLLPDKKTVLFTLDGKVMAQQLGSEKPKPLFDGFAARYLPSGHILYGDGNNLFTRSFDLDRLEATGGPEPAIEGVFQMLTGPQYAVSNSGTIAYIPGAASGGTIRRELVWVDRNGKEEVLSAIPNDYRGLRISPDGSRMTFGIYADGQSSIHIYDFERENMERLIADNENSSTSPVWSPDGQRIIFAYGQMQSGLYWKAADGTGAIEELYSTSDAGLFPQFWLGDGNTLIVMEAKGVGITDIAMLSVDTELHYTPLLTTNYAELLARISPDGRWIAYASQEGSQHKVYVRPFPEINKERIFIATGTNALWSPDGQELFYRGVDGIYVVPVQTKPSFKSGTPQFLFKNTYGQIPFADGSAWDIHPHSKRFLMLKPVSATDDASAAQGSRKINIILDWFEELKERVPE